jgi:hypothetical protein
MGAWKKEQHGLAIMQSEGGFIFGFGISKIWTFLVFVQIETETLNNYTIK